MTLLEYKNLLLKTSLEGGFPAVKVDEPISCSYLTAEGRKCAVGLLIPDGHDAQKARGDVAAILHDYPDLQGHMPEGSNMRLLLLIQRTHDFNTRVLFGGTKRTQWNHESFSRDIERIFKEHEDATLQNSVA